MRTATGSFLLVCVGLTLGQMFDGGPRTAAAAEPDCGVPYPDGSRPVAALVEGVDGSLYGATLVDGANSGGTIFRIDPRGELTVLHSFEGPHGSNPNSLLRGSDGSLYGATTNGGSAPVTPRGTVFRLDPTGALATLHEFRDSDGAYPALSRTQAMDGSIYGATYLGGANNLGTIFRMDPAGGFTTLHTFQGSDGAGPLEPPVLGADGSLYGTTSYTGVGPQPPFGTIYRLDPPVHPGVDPRWLLTTLHVFGGGTDGAYPLGALIQGQDHDFYGTTLGGGVHNLGTVFRIDPAGVHTKLYDFGGADGASPRAGLVQDREGNLYGTTYAGGTRGLGTVFRLNPAAALLSLHEFQGTDGAEPRTALVQGADGNLYGTTAYDDPNPNNHGTVFRLDRAGALMTIHFFRSKEGVVDCNSNDVRDACDIALGSSADCNANDAPDECDIDSGRSGDSNLDKIPDECGFQQLPGDANQDSRLNLSDVIWVLGHLFLGENPSLPCEGETASSPGAGELSLLDHGGDGSIDLSDAVGLLTFLFNAGNPPKLGTVCVRIAGCPEQCRA